MAFTNKYYNGSRIRKNINLQELGDIDLSWVDTKPISACIKRNNAEMLFRNIDNAIDQLLYLRSEALLHSCEGYKKPIKAYN